MQGHEISEPQKICVLFCAARRAVLRVHVANHLPSHQVSYQRNRKVAGERTAGLTSEEGGLLSSGFMAQRGREQNGKVLRAISSAAGKAPPSSARSGSTKDVRLARERSGLTHEANRQRSVQSDATVLRRRQHGSLSFTSQNGERFACAERQGEPCAHAVCRSRRIIRSRPLEDRGAV